MFLLIVDVLNCVLFENVTHYSIFTPSLIIAHSLTVHLSCYHAILFAVGPSDTAVYYRNSPLGYQLDEGLVTAMCSDNLAQLSDCLLVPYTIVLV